MTDTSTTTPMIRHMLQSAHDAGATAAVYLRGMSDTRLHGRVQAIDDTAVTLFHDGDAEGWLWAFRLEDIAAVALLTPRPSAMLLSTCSHHPAP
jgi:hypothetical protein